MGRQHEQRPDGHPGRAGNQEAPAQVGKAGDRGGPCWGRPRCSLAQGALGSQRWHQNRGGASFQPGFVLWTRSWPWLSVPLDQNLLTLTSPVLYDLFLISLQLYFYSKTFIMII